jgi:hypothetical protein
LADLAVRAAAAAISALTWSPPTTIRGFPLAKGAKGPFTTIGRPGATATAPFDVNNRGQIVGIAGNPADQASTQPTDTPPIARMS